MFKAAEISKHDAENFWNQKLEESEDDSESEEEDQLENEDDDDTA